MLAKEEAETSSCGGSKALSVPLKLEVDFFQYVAVRATPWVLKVI
jgi:hypothetical protein